MLLSPVGHKSQPECVRPVACGWHVGENAAGRGGVELTLRLIYIYIYICSYSIMLGLLYRPYLKSIWKYKYGPAGNGNVFGSPFLF